MWTLAGKTVLLTGASKGIGAEIAIAIGAAGANLIAHYGSDRAGAEHATAAMPPERVKLIGADLQDAKRWTGSGAKGWSGAGVSMSSSTTRPSCGLPVGSKTRNSVWDEVWDEALKVNVLAPVRLMRHAVRHYLQAGGGTLITISSWAAQRGPGNPALIAYAASKGAVLSATKTIARNYASKNILAYAIAPGVVRTRMSEQAAAAAGGEAVFTAGLAMGEWVPPSDIGNLAAFLSSGACRHLSGATLDVNGASYIR